MEHVARHALTREWIIIVSTHALCHAMVVPVSGLPTWTVCVLVSYATHAIQLSIMHIRMLAYILLLSRFLLSGKARFACMASPSCQPGPC